MRKVIGGFLMLSLLWAMACTNRGGDSNNYFLGERAGREGITAKAATFTDSVVNDSFSFWYVSTTSNFTGTTLFSDDASWSQINNQGNITSGYVYFGTSYSRVNDAYDTWGYLNVIAGGKGQPYEPVLSSLTMQFEDDNKELVFPAQNLRGLDVSRKVYANPWGSQTTQDDFCRWLEILTNNTGAPITVDVSVGGNLGSDTNTRVMASGDGDAVAEVGDYWFITKSETMTNSTSDQGDPILGHLVDGTNDYDEADNIVAANTTSKTILQYSTTGWSTTPYNTSTMTTSAATDSLLWTWSGVTVNPGETKILMHLEVMTLENDIPISRGVPDAIEAAQKLDSAPAEVVASMNADELNEVINWPAARNNCNVTGPAGSVKPQVLVEAENEDTLAVAQSYSLPDGSFGICINAAEGDHIKITADGKAVKKVKVEAGEE